MTRPARYRRVLAWLVGAMEQVFLGDLFPGIIRFGRVRCVRYSLAVTGWHGFLRPGDPRLVGHYVLIGRLGAGGMGDVYLAEDSRLDRKIALKMLREEFTQDPDRVMRFMREAKTTSALDHPNIVTIFDIGEADGRHYMATEYVNGQTLREHMTSPEPVAAVLEIGIQIAAALEAAHQAGIVHRDI